MVPKFYRDRGTLTAGFNPDVAPIKLVDDDSNIAGFTPDLLAAVADMLNLKLRPTQSSFDALIPGLSENRFDVLLSLYHFTSQQQVVTFVDYLNMGETIVVSPATKLSLKALDDMCGLQVALPRGSATTQESAASGVSKVGRSRLP
jgi:polar amino acid transport system substrate-binding protein